MTALVAAIGCSCPERTGSSFASPPNRPQPQAQLHIEYEDGQEQVLSAPVCVARALERNPPAVPCDGDDLAGVLDTIEAASCMKQVVKLLARRDYGSAELRARLLRQGFDEGCADQTIELARKRRLLDDQRSARAFAEGLARRGWGSAMIRLKLSARKFSEEEIRSAVAEFASPESDLARAAGVLARRAVPPTRPFEKLARYLTGKGYPSEIACSATRDHLERIAS